MEHYTCKVCYHMIIKELRPPIMPITLRVGIDGLELTT